ncbi:kinase-like domain-containing protein [Suillus clintonianus]|uniref:kinase-like domain-containing protein n=1 Tax=Suillus clintonianus TaxID=1904413 RepID=UPI001B88614F|nr:kinase-like domain-containing protein [Suillus clintonianus]KAG2129610.1 kinase-like domain-containing protein [Suillus clintonianus]
MSGLVFYAPPVAPLLPSSSSSNVRSYRYSSSASNERHALIDLSGDVVADTSVPTTSGGVTDVWKCTWFNDTGSTKVAVKTFRLENTNQGELAKTHKRWSQQIHAWAKLEHENIIPLYGIVMDFGPTVSIVHPWKENGTLSTYLSCKPALTVQDKFKLLENIVSGLHYLHSHGVVHGNLSGNNVLVDALGRASLADPGLSVLVPETLGLSYFRLSTSGAIRFAAPELFKKSSRGEVPLPSISGDRYSLGSIIYLVLSGSQPYSTLKKDSDVLVELLLGVAPASPSDSDKSITREQWQFIQGCWSEIPENRRSTNEALEFVDVNLALYVPFRAISLTEMHSRSSKTDGSKPRLVLGRRDFSPGDPLPPDIQASLAVGLRRSRNPAKAAEAAVSVILNDIFDISHVVPQWDSKETEHVVISHAYNVLVEDIKMISDALRVLQTSNPNAVERSLGTLRSTVEQLLFDERRKQRAPRSAFSMLVSKLQNFLDDLWKELYGNRGKLSGPFWEWFEKWMAMMRAWDNSQAETAVQNTATCLLSILS